MSQAKFILITQHTAGKDSMIKEKLPRINPHRAASQPCRLSHLAVGLLGRQGAAVKEGRAKSQRDGEQLLTSQKNNEKLCFSYNKNKDFSHMHLRDQDGALDISGAVKVKHLWQ